MTQDTSDAPLPDASSRTVLRIIRSGVARSRSEIARVAGLSPATVSDRVEKLIAARYLREAGEGASRGGRRPRTLEINPNKAVMCAVDLGTQHATIGLFDFAGRLITHVTDAIDIADGPTSIFTTVTRRAYELRAEHQPATPDLAGMAVALPGPVDARAHRLIAPSRMPGWNGVDARAELARIAEVPVVVDNDANLAAVGEFEARGNSGESLVYVKVGSSIGCGIIINGSLYRGHDGVAGDISHVTVPGSAEVLCSCGRQGCLDAVAGGRAVRQDLRDAGVDAADSAAVLSLADDGHPLATQLLRHAGTRVGSVLATIMNFFNPQHLVLGGILGESDAFVAGVQSAIYTECLPMVTGNLLISTSLAKQVAGIRGGAVTILDHVTNVGIGAI